MCLFCLSAASLLLENLRSVGSSCVWAIFIEAGPPSAGPGALKRFCEQDAVQSVSVFCGAVQGGEAAAAAGAGLLRRPRLLLYREILPHLVSKATYSTPRTVVR